jgi:hypothetical protein
MNVDGRIGETGLAVKEAKPLESLDFPRVRRFGNSTPNVN